MPFVLMDWLKRRHNRLKFMQEPELKKGDEMNKYTNKQNMHLPIPLLNPDHHLHSLDRS